MAPTKERGSDGYNMVVSNVPLISVANNTILNDYTMLENYSNDQRDAQTIA